MRCWDFEIKTDYLIQGKKTRPCVNLQEEMNLEEFAVPLDHRGKIKEREKKYLDFARELKN